MSWWTNPNLQPKTKSKFVVVFGGSFYLPNIKSLNKPKVEFDTKEYRLLNHKFNYPGNATWQPITMKFVDMNGMGMQTEHFDTGAFLWQIMNNTGYPAFNYDVFKRMYDDGEELKNIVADFDKDKIVIKTDQEAEDNPEMDFDNQGSTDKVKQMAKSAMNRRK